ncbi:hypothetical protein BC351_05490 [Paenibacillus ferrarius]|uniref:ABC3 transporter permease C-terminal domain-containing protein n=1 Tax=Paenibacillus ferrarius TaxID=1469647 RepID=A0A1V4HFZ5_9BACL|nr:ABC transporter permease [Paenibacillus ferrarius]OPH53329.1 hypothetical protein BC351_05490 [Paenibacillus ferrarius]
MFTFVKNTLFKQGIQPVLSIFQLLVGFLCLFFGFNYIFANEQLNSSVLKLSSLDTVRPVIKSIESPGTDKLNEYYSSLCSNPYVKNVGSFLVQDAPFKELLNNPYLNAPDSNTGRIKIGYVDRLYLQSEVFPVSSGRTLEQNDIKDTPTEEIPILISHNLSLQFPIGSILSSGVPDDRQMTIVFKKFVVIGVLQQNQVFWNGGTTSLDGAILESDAFFIAPIQEEQLYGNQLLDRISTNVLVTLNNINDFDKFKSITQEKMKQLQVTGSISTIKEQLELLKNLRKGPILLSLALSVVLISLSFIGLIGMQLYSVTKRRKEFAIRQALGASPISIILLVFSESALLIGISAVTAIGITYLLIEVVHIPGIHKFQGKAITYSIIIIFFLTISVSAPPLMKAFKDKPVNMLRGES